MQCLKCGAERNLQDLQCPECGVFYAKVQAALEKQQIIQRQREEAKARHEAAVLKQKEKELQQLFKPAAKEKRKPAAGEIICPNPNCGFIGLPDKKAKSNILFGIILFCFFMIPGILYAIAGLL